MKEVHRKFEGTILVSADSRDDFISALSALIGKFRSMTYCDPSGEPQIYPPINFATNTSQYSYSFCIDYDKEMTHEQYQRDLAEILPE
jgi:hypothetical protein